MRCCFVTNLQRASQIHKVTLHGEDQSKVRNVTSSYISHKAFWITYLSWITGILNSFNLSTEKYMYIYFTQWCGSKKKGGGGSPGPILYINYYCICSLFYWVSSLHHLLVLSTLWMGIVCCWWMETSGQYSSLLHVTNVQI